MNGLASKLAIGLVITAAVVVYLPKLSAFADTNSIFFPGFGYTGYDGSISPSPYYDTAPYGDLHGMAIYAPGSINFMIPIFGDFPGTDLISIDCTGTKGNNYDYAVSASSQKQYLYGQTLYDSSGRFMGYASYETTQASFTCSYPAAGTYSPHIRAVRTGKPAGCGVSSTLGGFRQEYYCWGDYSNVTATYDLPIAPFQILSYSYGISATPNGSPNVSFVIQTVYQQLYGSSWFGGVYNRAVGGYVNYSIDCYGDGKDIVNASGNSNATVMYAGQPAAAYNTGPVCKYTSPGVYSVLMKLNSSSSGATTADYRPAATVTILPSAPLSVQVTATPASGEAPLNNVKIHADAAGIMPATGKWASVTMYLRCDGNLQYENAVARGMTPDAAARAYGADGAVNDGYDINFGAAGTPMVSTASRDFSCSYPTAGTHTPTVVIQQSTSTAASGSKVDVTGELKCDGQSTNETKLHSTLTLDWATQYTNRCDALGDGWGWSGRNNVISPFVIPDLNATVGRTYTYTVRCYDSSDPSKYIESSCLVKVTP